MCSENKIPPARMQLIAAANVVNKRHPNGAPYRVKPATDPIWETANPLKDGVSAEMLLPNDFYLYSFGLVCASACTCLSPEEAAKRLNEVHPTGIESQWEVSEDEFFAGGKIRNGEDCPDIPGHKHFLFNC